MKKFRMVIFSILLTYLCCGCSIFQFEGHYVGTESEEYNSNRYLFPYRGQNGEIMRSAVISKIKLQSGMVIILPNHCSNFGVTGLFTPITPPIPLFWFRSWSTAECHFFTIKTKPETNVRLIFGGKTYEPTKANDLYNYTKYTFPIRAKNIDSGTIVIEKDGEKIEVPFEYKYFKFWY